MDKVNNKIKFIYILYNFIINLIFKYKYNQDVSETMKNANDFLKDI